MEEVWKDIVGYEGYYQISSYGRVKSLPRQIVYFAFGKTQIRMQKGRILKQSTCSSGYPIVHLYLDSERQNVMVHRLVAIHFLEPVEGREFVNHKDGDKENNNVANLEWVTKSENTQHAINSGLLLNHGENSYLSKLTEDQVKEVISLRKFGKRKYLAKDIAARYGLSERYVSELGVTTVKWARLKNSTSDEELYEIFLKITENWKPTGISRTPSKHKLTEEEKQEILTRRANGERVVDIAKAVGKSQKFVSWFTLKYLKGT